MTPNEHFTSNMGTLFVQPDGPNTEVYPLACHDLPDLTKPQGDVTQRLCPERRGLGWRIVTVNKSAPDRVTFTVSTYVGPTADWLEANIGCAMPIYIHQNRCGRVDSFLNYERAQVLQYGKILSHSETGLVAREGNDSTEQSFDVSADFAELYYQQIVRTLISGQAVAINDVIFADLKQCVGSCGEAFDLGSLGFAGLDSIVGVGQYGDVLVTYDGGTTWTLIAGHPFSQGTAVLPGDQVISVTAFPVFANGQVTGIRVMVVRDNASGGNGALDIAYSYDHAEWANVVVGAAGNVAQWNGALFALNEQNVYLTHSNATPSLYYPTESADDADVDSGAGGTIQLAAVTLTWGKDAAGDVWDAGIRFRSVAVPPGANIHAAWINGVCAVNAANNTCNARLYGELNATPALFTTYANFIGRARTVAFTEWPAIPAWVTPNIYTTPDITTLIQEIVDLGGWLSGNDLVVFVEDTTSDATADRNWASWDHGALDEPELYIYWSVAGSISKSTDGGLTWTLQQLTNDSMNYIKFCNENDGIAVGDTEEIWITNDGGIQWQAPSGLPGKAAIDILCCDIIDRYRMWVGFEDGQLWYTRDGSLTWTRRHFTLPAGMDTAQTYQINDIQFVDEFCGRFVLQFQRTGSVAATAVYRTTNGGLSWEYEIPVDTVFNWNALWACDYHKAFLVGEMTAGAGQIHVTEDRP